jgi:Carboxypeptidase regulatory-like domain
MPKFRWTGSAIALLAMMLVTLPLFGQATTTGNIYGKVVDESGGVLPGVTVTLSGVSAPQTTYTDTRGQFHFLELSPGTYTLNLALQGFATVNRTDTAVTLGRNTEVTITMKLSSVAATVTVSGETPLLDTRKQETGHVFTQAELSKLPSARDPWVILQQTPSVLVDRMNVGGSQSGQQDNYVGKGTDPSQNSWSVDGVTITDMAATGSSPTYYDFDAFQEMQATTGGADPSVSVPGVSLNMVTKRGTNEVKGSARVFITNDKYEAFNIPSEAKAQGLTATNRISGIQDYGVEAGGPIWPDKAWIWGSYGRNQIDLLQTAGTFDKTTLENTGAKLNVQPIDSNSATVFFFRGDKIKLGRNSGPTRPQPTSWDQSGPTRIWKLEDSQVFGANAVASLSYAYVDGGFGFVPEGGNLTPTTGVYQDASRVWQRSYVYFNTFRPQHQLDANGSLFFNTGSLGHEVKFGFGYRKAEVKSNTVWPGNQLVAYQNYFGSGNAIAEITRPRTAGARSSYISGFLSDTLTASNLTVNLGIRYDDQYGNNLPSKTPANPIFPDIFPGLNYGGSGVPFKWTNWEPRVGVTYALGPEKKTLLRASYARFADQLGQGNIEFNNPVGYSYLYYYWNDKNGDKNIQPGELGDFYYAYGVDPNNPSSATSPNLIDRNLKAPTTDEITAGIDHELMPDLVLGATYTYRYRKNFIWSPLIGVTGADFVQVSPGVPGVDYKGNSLGMTGPIYGLATPYSGDGGRILTNRPDYHTTYNGVELQMTKRLSHKWMAHASFTWTDWKEHVGNKSAGCIDPTNLRGNSKYNPDGNTCADGDIAYFGGASNSGSFGYVFINSKWAFNINGLYQLPWNFNIAANLYGRQGYPIPYYVRYNAGDGLGGKNVAIGNADNARNSNVYQLDMRIDKNVPLFNGGANLDLSIDVFNVFNSGTILQRQNNATPNSKGTSNAGLIFEVQSPRVARFGARISF